jgi:hypothetical protein
MPKPCIYLIILAIGFLVRLLAVPMLPFDSDQAIVGLMGKHILEGSFPWIYYGDSYCGTLEPALAAWVFLFNGISRSGLQFIPFCFSVLFLLSVYQLGRQLYNPLTGLIGMFLAALPPFYFGLYSAMAYGGYIEILWLGNLVLLLTYRLVNSPKGLSSLPLFFLGILWGLIWWTHPLGLVYLLTSGLVILFCKKEFLFRAKGIISLPGFFLGSLPFWLWNGFHGFPFLNFTRSGPGLTYGAKMQLLLAQTLQVFAFPIKKDLLFLIPWPKILLLTSAFFLILFGMGTLLLLTGKRGRALDYLKAPGPILLITFLVVFFVIYTGSRFIESPDALRYFLPLYTVFPLILAHFYQALKEKSRLLSYGLILFFLSFGLYHNAYLFFFYRNNEIRYQKQHLTEKALFQFLRSRGIRYAYAPEYWSAPALTFNAQEQPIFTLPFKDRYPLYTLRADASAVTAYVLEGKHRQSFEAMFKAAGGSYQREIFAPYPNSKNFYVYYNFTPPQADFQEITPELWRGTSNVNAADASLAFDRNVSTSWSSLSPQTKETYYQIDLGGSYRIAHIVLSPGLERAWEFPASYDIKLSQDGKDWHEVISVKNNWAYLFWSSGRPLWKLRNGRTEVSFPHQLARYVKISLTESASYPWSIGELFVYQMAPSSNPVPPPTKDIISFLKKERIEFIYADKGLSAEITQGTEGKIKCPLEEYDITQGSDYGLWGYNGAFPYGGSLKNRVDFSQNPAFIVAREDNPAFQMMIKTIAHSYRTRMIGNYMVYSGLEVAPSRKAISTQGFSAFYWTGTHLLKMNLPGETQG